MPNERMRALRWGHEMLQELCGDTMVSDGDRARAAELLRTYPAPDAVSEWIHKNVACIPINAASAIEGTGTLLRSIWYSEACPPQLRHNLKFTLRHFPDPGAAVLRTDGRGAVSIRTWLLPENHFG